MGMKAILSGLAACFLACSSKAADPTLQLDLGGGVSLDLVLVPAGSFVEGSPEGEAGRGADESPREVTISRDFYFGQTAVTRQQWERFVTESRYRTEAEVGNSGGYGWNGKALEQRKEFTWKNPGFPQTPEHPVCLVTFPDAQAFCAWLERKTHRKVTLPTEAQWEYACRGRTALPWHGGNSEGSWHKDNAGNGTRPVDSKPANAWGIHIGGNVSEWCLDWYAPYPAGAATNPLQDNPNLSDKPRRVLRGGSWIRGASNTRSAARYRADPRSRNADIGFRILCSTEAPAAAPVAPSETPPVEIDSSRPVEALPPVPERTETIPQSEPSVRVTSTGSPLLGLIKGLMCLTIPFGIIFTIIRKTLLSRQAGPPSAPLLSQQPSRAFPSPVRRANDGFWIQGDWPEGTLLNVRYMLAGVEMAKEILYRPGQDGQFIFTGDQPASVSVVAGNDPSNSIGSPLFGNPPPFPNRRRDDGDDRGSRPPRSPSAY